MKTRRKRRAHLRLGHPDVPSSEQELPVQVAHVDRVEVDQLDVGEPAERERLEELASDAAGADHENLGGARDVEIRHLLNCRVTRGGGRHRAGAARTAIDPAKRGGRPRVPDLMNEVVKFG
eukprot:31358-Pelagococcus_subviridis.AAC.5